MTRQIQTQLGARDTNRLILAFLVAIAADVVFVFLAQIPILSFANALVVFALLTPILWSKKVNALLALQAPALLRLIRPALAIAGVIKSIFMFKILPAWTIWSRSQRCSTRLDCLRGSAGKIDARERRS